MGGDNGDKALPGFDKGLDKGPPGLFSKLKLLIPLIVMQSIGGGIAFAVYTYGDTAKYGKRIVAAIEAEQEWAFAALLLLAFTVRYINFYPMLHKSRIMSGSGSTEIGKNLRSNPFILRAVGKGASANAVIFENDGAVGSYNRANRSLHHMVENFGSLLAGLFLAASIFPLPTFVCIAIWCAGRVLHQDGYSTGYGKHGVGFMLSTLATVTIEGMCCLVVAAAAGFLPVAEAAAPKVVEAVTEAATEAAA